MYISAFESSLNELMKVAEETAESMKENDCRRNRLKLLLQKLQDITTNGIFAQ